jgi:hypothetical protein
MARAILSEDRIASPTASHLLSSGVHGSISELLGKHLKRFRGGLVFKAHILLYHSTLGWRVIKKRKFRV